MNLILFAFFLIFNLVINPLHFKLFHVGCLFGRIFREVLSVHSCSRYVAVKIRTKKVCVVFLRGNFLQISKDVPANQLTNVFSFSLSSDIKDDFRNFGCVLFPMLANLCFQRPLHLMFGWVKISMGKIEWKIIPVVT